MRRRLREWIARYGLLSLLVAALVGAGSVIAGGAVLEWSNTEAFCISCHEMRENAFAEYQQTIHARNRTGNRTTCPDCHVPREFWPKMWRKIVASKELFFHLTGKLDTPEKYEQHRYQLALNEWRRLKANDSRECRHCHDQQAMSADMQERRTVDRHNEGVAEGRTCIDCHFAIAHREPEGDLLPEDL